MALFHWELPMLIGPNRLFLGDSASWIEHTDIRWRTMPKIVDVKAVLKVGDNIARLETKLVPQGLDLTLKSDESLRLSPGKGYIVCSFLNSEQGFAKTLVLSDEIQVLPSVSDPAFDPRTDAEKALAQAKEALRKFTQSNGKVKSYTIGTRTLQFRDIDELRKLVEYWEFEVIAERAARHGTDPRVSLVRFRND